MSEFKEELIRLCDRYAFPLTAGQAEKMELYYTCLVEANRQYNITAITQPKDAALKHFFDSIAPCAHIPQQASVLDVGSGGGFPIVPLKIVREDIHACANEASGKKCEFIRQAAQKAGIAIGVQNARAEELAHGELRERFDVCVSRAVAALPILMELCVPFVKQGGLFFAYKGAYQEELDQAKQAAKSLGVELTEIVRMNAEEQDHSVLVFRKKTRTPQNYPRNYAQIRKRPL